MPLRTRPGRDEEGRQTGTGGEKDRCGGRLSGRGREDGRDTRTGVADETGAADKDGGGGKRGSIFGPSGGQGRVRRTRKGAVDEDGGGGKRDSVFGRTRTGAADEVVGRIG